MELCGGETIIFNLGDAETKWRLSKIDCKLVKFFDENGCYTQMPYNNFMRLLENGNAKIYSGNENEDMG